jgi:hypothetical protein
MLQIARKKTAIRLPSGPKAVVQELVGKHQRNLTEQKISKETKINMLIADVLVSVAGVPYESYSEAEKMNFVEKMVGADRKYILTEARQLAMSHDPVYHHRYEYKDADGVKQEVIYEISLIDSANIEKMVQKIEAHFPDKDEDFLACIKELNRIGCFPTKPYFELYDDYKSVLDNKLKQFTIEELFPDTTFIFSLMDGRIEASIKADDLSSHTRILCRTLRYKEGAEGAWKKVTREILDELPIQAVDRIRNEMDRFEGAVDTIEAFPNPDELKGGNITIDIVGEVSFFFPSGKV